MANPFEDILRNYVPADLGGQITMPPPAPPPSNKMSRGQIIAGIIGDALAGAAGRGPSFGPMVAQQRQHQQDQASEQAQWQLRRQAEREDRAPYRWEANDGSLMEMGPDGAPRVVYKDPTPKANLDPDVFITLPNGQVYAGPRSGLASAMTGGGQMPQVPVGKLTPIDGGPASQAPGGFSY